jgi:hypothetical protein
MYHKAAGVPGLSIAWNGAGHQAIKAKNALAKKSTQRWKMAICSKTVPSELHIA